MTMAWRMELTFWYELGRGGETLESTAAPTVGARPFFFFQALVDGTSAARAVIEIPAFTLRGQVTRYDRAFLLEGLD